MNEKAFPSGNGVNPYCYGMDLRDFFAAICMPIATEQESRHSNNPSYHGTAHRAYAFADAMIAERNK